MINPAEPKINYKTWMLFESGNGVAVNLSLYPLPKDSTRPIDAYVVTETAGDFTKSARRAAAAVYDILQHRFPDIPQRVVGFDLQGYSRTTTGESGGLPFAIALAKRLLKQDPGPVAATGEIVSGHSGGQIGPVKGIIEKFKAAEQLLPEGGWLFYPQHNNTEISDELRKILTEKGIKLHPVSDVKEVLALFFDWDASEIKPEVTEHMSTVANTASIGTSKTQKSQTALWPLLVLFFVITGVAAWFYFPKSDVNKDTGKDQILTNPSPKLKNTPKAKLPENNVAISSVSENKPTTPAFSHQITADFNGEDMMAAELAGLLNKQLPQFLLDNDITLPDTFISGIVKIVEINEEAVNEQGDVRSSMTVILNELRTNINNISKSYPDLQITVQKNVKLRSFLPIATDELSSRIIDILIKEEINKAKGFE
jgi:hypothetical protein